MSKIKRNSGVELLRLIAMFLILSHHYSVHGGFEFIFGKYSANKIFIDILASVGKLGVNIFMVITSYYLLKSKPRIKKVIIFIFEVTFYSSGIYIICSYLFNDILSINNFIESLLPFVFSTYWFATTYIILYIISPLLNILIENLDKKKYFYYLLILSFIFVVIPTFMYKAPEFSNLVWFIYIYLLVGYFAKYPNTVLSNNKKCILYSIIGLLFIITSVILFNIIGLKVRVFFEHSAYFSSINKVPSLVTSIFLFFTFKNINIKYNRIINYISSSVFSVYLIHDNPYFSTILWNNICNNRKYNYSPKIVIHYLVCSILIFIICILVDKIRVCTIGRGFNKIVEYLIVKNKSKIKQLDNYLTKKIELNSNSKNFN